MTAPTALSRSIDHALGIESLPTDAKRPARDLSAAARDSLQAAEQILDRVLAGACESRASALDLLTVDALVTRSMEIAARDPQLLADFPELAMKRLSAR